MCWAGSALGEQRGDAALVCLLPSPGQWWALPPQLSERWSLPLSHSLPSSFLSLPIDEGIHSAGRGSFLCDGQQRVSAGFGGTRPREGTWPWGGSVVALCCLSCSQAKQVQARVGFRSTSSTREGNVVGCACWRPRDRTEALPTGVKQRGVDARARGGPALRVYMEHCQTHLCFLASAESSPW